ncbi:MAG: hypothetical protein IT307_02825 [Chloroflexi bacterium]|nr:hypothetical protein [Chloroflexota bacterium]
MIRSVPSQAEWTAAGFSPDLELLGRLLVLADPQNTTGAAVATTLDMWVAEQLRVAGIQNVLPRRDSPYYVNTTASFIYDAALPSRVEKLMSQLTDTAASLQADLEAFGSHPSSLASSATRAELRKLASYPREIRRIRAAIKSAFATLLLEVSRPTTTVLGEGRRKQIDVVSSAWDRGLELAVSTKTLALGVEKPAELLKNLPNRWEEFDGDLKNPRGRFPR